MADLAGRPAGVSLGVELAGRSLLNLGSICPVISSRLWTGRGFACVGTCLFCRALLSCSTMRVWDWSRTSWVNFVTEPTMAASDFRSMRHFHGANLVGEWPASATTLNSSCRRPPRRPGCDSGGE